VLGWRGGEEGPHVGDGLLIGRREAVEVPLNDAHLVLVGGTTTLGVWPVSVTEPSIWVFLDVVVGLAVGGDAVLWYLLPNRRIDTRDVFFEEGADVLAHEVGGHSDEARRVVLLWSSPVAVLFGWM